MEVWEDLVNARGGILVRRVIVRSFEPAAEFPLELWPPFGTLDFKPYLSQIMAVKNLKQVAVHTSLWAGDQATFDKQARSFGMFDKIAVFLDDSSTNLAVQMALGAVMEMGFLRRIYGREHILQLLLTYALILVLDLRNVSIGHANVEVVHEISISVGKGELVS